MVIKGNQRSQIIESVQSRRQKLAKLEAGRVVDRVKDRGGFGGELVEFDYSLKLRVCGGGGGIDGRVSGAELVELGFPASSTAWFKGGDDGEGLTGLRRGEAAAEEVLVMEVGSE